MTSVYRSTYGMLIVRGFYTAMKVPEGRKFCHKKNHQKHRKNFNEKNRIFYILATLNPKGIGVLQKITLKLCG
jgi:hypothetical protein